MPTFLNVASNYPLGAYNSEIIPYVSIDLGLSPLGDFQLDPIGNLETATGNQKLTQDIKLFLLSPLGTSLMDSSWGNQVISMIGKAESAKGQVASAVSQALTALQTFKNIERTQRPIEASELIDAILNVEILSEDSTDNVVSIVITLATHQDNQVIIKIPLG